MVIANTLAPATQSDVQDLGLLDRLSSQPADALLALIGAYQRDPRPNKIDVGVGVYRDQSGQTPVMRAVKAAEYRLLADQSTKAYLGPEGDIAFFELLQPVIFGKSDFDGRVSGLQTPGGTGALRLAAEVIANANPDARVLVGTPTWPNHGPILAAARLPVVPYRFFDPARQAICFDEMLDAFREARAGDVVLLHGCCHNPTGADLDIDQWAAVADVVADRGLLPFIDLAYQGLGRGLAADSAGPCMVLDAVPEALIAYSCDKNFGLYRERTGALFAFSRDRRAALVTQSNLLALARANWSMPPDHGAAIVRTILQCPELTGVWEAELDKMCRRIVDIRTNLASLDHELAPLTRQKGMFSTLPLSPEQVRILRDEHAVYMTGSGRVSLPGLTPDSLAPFVAALAAVR
jgi:aromatic-amino-acid transaminase